MDILIEILIELIFEGSSELLKNKKVPKWIRIIIASIFVSLLCALIVLGILILRKSIIGGIIIIVFGLFLLIGSIIKIRNHLKNNKKYLMLKKIAQVQRIIGRCF